VSLTVHVPSALREHTGGRATIDVPEPGDTVASALEALFALHPGLRDRLVTERFQLRPHVAVFLGTESIRHSGGLDSPIADAAELTIVPAVSGG